MNIIFITREPYPYGMAGSSRVRLFAEYLVKNKCTVTVLINNRHNGINKHKGVNNLVKYTMGRSKIFNIFFGSHSIKQKLKSLFSPNDVNIILLYNGISITNILYVIFGKILKYKIITDIVEDFSLHHEPLSFRLKILRSLDIYLEKYSHFLINGIIVISEYLLDKNKHIGKNIIKIPISAGNLYNSKKRTQGTSSFIFKYSGSFGKKDGIDFLLKAFQLIQKKYDNVELILAGEKSKNNKIDLEHFNKNLNIKFIGRVPDIDYYTFLADSNVLIMPRIKSKYANAGFPFKLGEYLATKNPVIATETSDINFYLKDKYDVIMVRPSSTESLYNGMKFAIENKQNIEIIGQNGYNAAKKYFNPENNGKMLLNFLRQIN